MRATAPSGIRILTLTVTLEGTSPPIWRRIQIPDGLTLGGLHYALQIVMGWSNDHLHEFQVGRKRYGTVRPNDYDPECVTDERETELRDVFKRKNTKLRYIYDFGDRWTHQVVVEHVSEPEPGVRYPVCLGGERRCPPEDCGGIGGYDLMLEALQDPSCEAHDAYRGWLASDFDPDDFDLNRVNRSLEATFNRDLIPERAEEAEEHSETSADLGYEEPVCRLLTLGEPKSRIDYATLGIGPEHIPELIRMVTDMALHRSEHVCAQVWAPVHSWRALGALRAEAAIDPLVDLLRLVDEEQDDWAGEDIPQALADIGPPAIAAVSAFLQDESRGLWGRVAASQSLSNIGKRHPEAREACVAVLTAQLERHAENDKDLNAFLISALMDLGAVESASAMERAFAADSVDLCVLGDWEEVQIGLGLLDKRITPPPVQGWIGPLIHGTQRPRKPKVSAPPTGKIHRKARKKRREQKSSRRKNRKK